MRFFPLRLIPKETELNFLGKKWIAFMLSMTLIGVSCVSLFTKGLNFGIDFTGGIVIEARLEEAPDLKVIRAALSDKNLGEVALQNIGSQNDLLIRLERQEGGEEGQAAAITVVKQALTDYAGDTVDYRKIDFVGPQVGQELIHAGTLSLLFAFGAIMVYIWLRFEWQFGVGAIIALIHDVLLTLGFFSIMNIEFNLTSIAAILTIIGYSINDSVVIYDRIRENLRKYKKLLLEAILNMSINHTLSRTILTAGSTIMALVALVWFGGHVIQGFSLAVLFGVIIGTYSSIYIAAPVLIFLNVREKPTS